MVLLPCSACCGTPCTCPTCDACCSCAPWSWVFELHDTLSSPPSYYQSLYTDLLDLLPGCITRPYESQSACFDAMVAEYRPAFPELTDQEIRDMFQADWADNVCGNNITLWYGSWVGWSVPYINGVVATAAVLEQQCPNGAPPASSWCGSDATRYWYVQEFAGSSGATPDIRKLVLATPGTGDWIVDALLERGTQDDLPAEGWVEADDCASCADPAVLETDCDPAGDYKVFYSKTVTVEDSFTNLCNSSTDVLQLCPPQNCKLVTITVTRTNQCSPHSPASPEVTSFSVILAVCPCGSLASVYSSPLNAESEPVVIDGYGYASEQDCLDDLTASNCLGGTPSSQCIGDAWKQVRHAIDGTRDCLESVCTRACDPPGCCS
jgi:hypothetical protein